MDGFERYIKQVSKRMEEVIKPKLEKADNKAGVLIIDRWNNAVNDVNVNDAIFQERKEKLFSFVNRLSTETIAEIGTELEIENFSAGNRDERKQKLVEELLESIF